MREASGRGGRRSRVCVSGKGMRDMVGVYSSGKGLVKDRVAVSKRMRILVNGRHVARITLSPSLEEEAVVGYLAGQGIVKYQAISKIKIRGDVVEVAAEGANAFILSEAGDCGNWTEAVVKGDVSTEGIFVGPAVLKRVMEKLQSGSKVWQETGGTHACGFFGLSGALKFMAEDVSRHVALDKVVGMGLKAGVDFKKGIIATTGRISASCVLKCARMGVPAVVSRSAPLLEAVEAANSTGITLLGFARGNRYNVYSNVSLFYAKV